jgi:LPS-assembly protein
LEETPRAAARHSERVGMQVSMAAMDVLLCRLRRTRARMTSRNRIFITAVLLCHGLLWTTLLTSQLRPAKPVPTEEITIKAFQQEKIGDIYRLRGNPDTGAPAEIDFRDYIVRADEITYNQTTGDITASGHLTFEGGPGDLHIQSSRATYNIKSESGKFYDVIGTTGAKIGSKNVLLTSSTPFAFSGKLVEKSGKDRIIVHQGTVTSCTIEDPKWVFRAEKVDVVLGENAKLYHSTFRLSKIPIFYFPFATLPVEKVNRQSGFMIPSIGQSSRKGTIIGESFYWAINRSADLTLGAEFWSKRGWAEHGQFRSRPSDTSFLNVKFFGVNDRGIGTPPQKQGGQDASVVGEDAALPFGFRGVANLNYLSTYVFRLAFSETFTQAVNSEVKSVAFASKARSGYFFNLMGERYQNFQSTTPGDVINILHTPSIDLASVDHKLGSLPIYYSYDAAVQGVSRREPGFITDNLVGRADLHPRGAVPFHIKGWDFRPEIALRNTYYTQRQDPLSTGIGTPGSSSINRKALETSLEIRPPTVSKIFERPVFGSRIKHTIEPRVIYRYVNGVDNFSSIIRFDARDILSDTNEVEYALVNRIFARKSDPESCDEPIERFGEEPVRPDDKKRCTVGTREVFTWEIVQKYFFDTTFGSALITGQRNVFTTTAELTGIAFLTDPRRFSPIVSRLRIRTARNTDIEWHLDYDLKKGRINASTALVSKHFGDFFVGGSQAYLQTPNEANTPSAALTPTNFNQFRWLMGYGNPNKRGISAATNIGIDVTNRFLQYGAAQISYNWDCCGFSVEYRRLALGAVRNENQFRFALNLTNIGTFGTLRRQERLF